MDIQEPRGESWKARAPAPRGSVQAPTVGMTASGADRVVADKAQTYCPRLERLVPWVVKNRSCPDTMNSFISHHVRSYVALDQIRNTE